MKFDMFIGYKNVRDNVEDTEYEFEIFIIKDQVACLRLRERANFCNLGFIRKSDRIEKLGMYFGICYFLDYMKTSPYFLEPDIELVIHVKTKDLFTRVTKGSGSLEDCLITKKIMERVKFVIEGGCNVQFEYKKDDVKKWVAYSRKSISNFNVLDEKCRWFSLVSLLHSLDRRQKSLDDRVGLILGKSYKKRREYYIRDKVGVPFSLSAFNALMD